MFCVAFFTLRALLCPHGRASKHTFLWVGPWGIGWSFFHIRLGEAPNRTCCPSEGGCFGQLKIGEQVRMIPYIGMVNFAVQDRMPAFECFRVISLHPSG